MSARNTEIVVDLHERFQEVGMETVRDVLARKLDMEATAAAIGAVGDYITERVDPAVEVETRAGQLSLPDMPRGTVLRGWDGWLEFWRGWLEPWGEDWRFEIGNLTERGEHVLLDLWIAAHGRESGIPVEMRFSQVWTVRSGRIVRLTVFDARDEALGWLASEGTAGQR